MTRDLAAEIGALVVERTRDARKRLEGARAELTDRPCAPLWAAYVRALARSEALDSLCQELAVMIGDGPASLTGDVP